MKKFLLSLAAVLTLGFAASAVTETYVCSTLGSANVNPLESVTVGKVTMSFDKNGGSNAPAYYANGNDIRMYAKNMMTVTAEEGYKVEKLVFTYTTNWTQIGKVTASLGSVDQTDGAATWSGNASSFTLTVSEKAELGADPTKAGQFRFTSVEVTYSEGEGEVTPTPDPEDPTEVYTVAEALHLIESDQIPSSPVQVKGIISKIDEVSTSYGNATYYIKDNLEDADALEVFRGYWLNGDKFTATNQIAVGGEVVVEGTLVNYNGTYEFTTGSKIISYKAPEGGGNSGDDNTPEGEGVLLEGWTNVEWTGDGEGWTGVCNGYTIAIDKASSSNDLVKPDSYSIRVYQGATITVTAPDGVNFNQVLITLDSLTKGYTATVSDGWTATSGSEDDLKFVVSNTEAKNSVTLGADKQLRIKSFTIYGGNAGVEGVVADDANAPVEYFNLQGVRVANPENGLYIRRQGNTVTKVIVK